MVFEKSIAVLFLALIIISRTWIFLFPSQAKKLFSSVLKWPNANFKILGFLFFMVSISIFYLLAELLNAVQIIAVLFAFSIFLAAGFFWHREFYDAMLNVLIKKDGRWIRIHTGAAVIIALLLLYFIIR